MILLVIAVGKVILKGSRQRMRNQQPQKESLGGAGATRFWLGGAHAGGIWMWLDGEENTQIGQKESHGQACLQEDSITILDESCSPSEVLCCPGASLGKTELEEATKKERSYYKYAVGDCNAFIYEEKPATARIGPHGTGDANKNGELFMDFLKQCNLSHRKSLFMKKIGPRVDMEEPWRSSSQRNRPYSHEQEVEFA
ncbi:hypothetical protein OSTOST_04320, partial [Ostertagia ostertagi]